MLLQNKSRAAFWPQEVNIPERKCYCLFGSHGGFLVKVTVCFGKCLTCYESSLLYVSRGIYSMIMVVVMLCFQLDSTFLRMKSRDFSDVDYEKKNPTDH